jgi:hypothetical protein
MLLTGLILVADGTIGNLENTNLYPGETSKGKKQNKSLSVSDTIEMPEKEMTVSCSRKRQFNIFRGGVKKEASDTRMKGTCMSNLRLGYGRLIMCFVYIQKPTKINTVNSPVPNTSVWECHITVYFTEIAQYIRVALHHFLVQKLNSKLM